MNFKGIQRIKDGEYLVSEAHGSFTSIKQDATKIYYTDDAISIARKFDKGYVRVVDLTDSDRVIADPETIWLGLDEYEFRQREMRDAVYSRYL